MVPSESKQFDSIRVYITSEIEPVQIDSNLSAGVSGLLDQLLRHSKSLGHKMFLLLKDIFATSDIWTKVGPALGSHLNWVVTFTLQSAWGSAKNGCPYQQYIRLASLFYQPLQ